jgi:hypothetical protein
MAHDLQYIQHKYFEDPDNNSQRKEANGFTSKTGIISSTVLVQVSPAL